ncbi:hypothetical protein NXV57_16190 [Bacteroides thetaiotaomicron]|nr:hypothetical protein [Bacteroides thetaiotaomicron]
MRKEVEQLALMGAMPDEADERITAALVDEYADLLGKIVKPVTLDEAHILIKLFPPTALYGIEWTLLHLIESVYSEIKSLEYRELINECNSTEFKKMLVQRLNNSQQKKLLTKQDNAYSVPRLAIISDPKQTNVWKSMI